MKLIYAKSFKKDLSKIHDRVTRQKIKKAILKAKKAESIDKITNLKSPTDAKVCLEKQFCHGTK